MSFDFLYFPLACRGGRQAALIPGLRVCQAVPLAHRHRRHDLLAMLLTLTGDHRYDPQQIEELTGLAASSFFQAQGSVTRAMQSAAEFLNKAIYDRNLERGFEGLHALASLALAVLHNDWLFIAQAGRAQALFIDAQQVQRFSENLDADDALGASRRVQMRFSQCEVQAGDLLILSDRAPASWTAPNLQGSPALSLAQVRRRLLNQVTDSLEALLIKFPSGRGLVRAADLQAEEPSAPQPVPTTSPSLPEEMAQESAADDLSQPMPGAAASQSQAEQLPSAYDQAEEPLEGSAQPADLPQDEMPILAGKPEASAQSEEEEPPAPFAIKPAPTLLLTLAKAWRGMASANVKVRQFIQRFGKRAASQDALQPNSAAHLLRLLLVVALPLALVLVGITVFNQSGKNEQHQALVEQGQLAAQLAEKAEDITEKHQYWTRALELATTAQEYAVSPESQALFNQAQTAVDEMDLAGRLDFKPALTQFFPQEVRIRRILSSSSGVYLLDETTGSILRIYLNSKGFYELDSEFQCSPGAYGLSTVTKLVDFEILPANKDNYRVLALDEQGNLLYCRPGEFPDSRTLPLPMGGWKRLAAAALQDNILYIVDAGADAIWMYEGQDPEKSNNPGVTFSKNALKFLDEDVPDLGGAMDVAINQEDLYVLHEDGHMSLCRYSALKDVKLTECQDPAPFSDSRTGREKKPWIFMDTRFEMLQQTHSPNAALYILDSANRAINQFSMQLNLERVLKAQTNRNYPIPDIDPSGFGITADMEIFLAFGNQLFIAPLR